MCPLCDKIFFAKLAKEASKMAGCFHSRVMIQECRLLLDYVIIYDYGSPSAVDLGDTVYRMTVAE